MPRFAKLLAAGVLLSSLAAVAQVQSGSSDGSVVISPSGRVGDWRQGETCINGTCYSKRLVSDSVGDSAARRAAMRVRVVASEASASAASAPSK